MMDRMPFQSVNNGQVSAPLGSWQPTALGNQKPQFQGNASKAAGTALSGSDAAHFIAHQRMERPAKPQDLASPQSLPPTPKRRSSSRANENFNPNAFQSIPEDTAASQDMWRSSLNTAAARRYLRVRKDEPGHSSELRDSQQGLFEVKAFIEGSAAPLNVCSPAECKQKNMKDAIADAQPLIHEELWKRPPSSLKEELSQELTAHPHSLPASGERPAQTAADTQQRETGLSEGQCKKQSWHEMLQNGGHRQHTAKQELDKGKGAAAAEGSEQPHAPKQSSISLQALAPAAGKPHTFGSRDGGATSPPSRAENKGKVKVTSVNQVDHTAKEYKQPAQKPKPARTGLEAATYPCYTEILQRARLRPERPPGPPQRKRAAQPPPAAAVVRARLAPSRAAAAPRPAAAAGRQGDTLTQADTAGF